jgi:hypothetical protein
MQLLFKAGKVAQVANAHDAVAARQQICFGLANAKANAPVAAGAAMQLFKPVDRAVERGCDDSSLVYKCPVKTARGRLSASRSMESGFTNMWSESSVLTFGTNDPAPN